MQDTLDQVADQGIREHAAGYGDAADIDRQLVLVRALDQREVARLLSAQAVAQWLVGAAGVCVSPAAIDLRTWPEYWVRRAFTGTAAPAADNAEASRHWQAFRSAHGLPPDDGRLDAAPWSEPFFMKPPVGD